MHAKGCRSSLDSLYWRLPAHCQQLLFGAYGWWYSRQRVNAKCTKYLEQMRSQQSWSLEETQAFQSESLRCLIEHAVANVPYYGRVFRQHRLHPKDIRTTSDLTKLPLLTKDLIRQNYRELISSNASRISHLRDHTGGSSGDPFCFLLPRDLRYPFATAALFSLYERAGYRFGASYVTLAARKICEGKPFWRYNRAANQLFLSSKDLTSETAPKYAQRVREFSPKFMTGHPTIIGFFADWLNHHHQSIPLTAVITSSETLDNKTRSSIEGAFDCRVFDTYGMGEQVIMAGECSAHDGMHIVPSYGIAEVVDDGGCPASGRGRVIGTSLRNSVMPFLRYDTGDIACLQQAACSCGCCHARLTSMEGRADDLLMAADGSVVFPAMIRKAFLNENWLTRFQLLQHPDGSLTVRLEHERNLNPEQEERVRRIVSGFMRGPDYLRAIEVVATIPRTAGQKLKLVMCDRNGDSV